MAESEEEQMSLLMKVKDESDKSSLKLNIQKAKIKASSPITSWYIDGENIETVADFIFLGSRITVDGDCNHGIKRRLLLKGLMLKWPILRPPDVKSWLIRKDPDAGKDWRQEEKGTTEDEMVGWHHWLDGHEFEQALGDCEG